MAIDVIDESWQHCLAFLKNDIPQQAFDTWIKPLQAKFNGAVWVLYAPNHFVKDKVTEKFLSQIQTFLGDIAIEVGHGEETFPIKKTDINQKPSEVVFKSNINKIFTFDSFVEGKSNQVAKAAAIQVSVYHGQGYNPLFIYGGVGLGKTHLMQAVGNEMRRRNPALKAIYLHSERFVSEMICALQTNTISKFKDDYRSLDALFIDDIQFFAGKERSQEELFHIFNSLLESGRQMIFTCDRYPKEIEGLEERLKSRFGWGLTVAIDPPELETRVAILLNKSAQMKATLSSEVAFFIAKRVRSNVRELEGALKRVIAGAQFTGREITIDLVKEALRDLIALQDKLITIENIQKTVAEYYKIVNGKSVVLKIG